MYIISIGAVHYRLGSVHYRHRQCTLSTSAVYIISIGSVHYQHRCCTWSTSALYIISIGAVHYQHRYFTLLTSALYIINIGAVHYQHRYFTLSTSALYIIIIGSVHYQHRRCTTSTSKSTWLTINAGSIGWRNSHLPRGGESSVVRARDSWLKGRGFESLPERWESFLCWLLFRYPFHSRVTAVARKRPRSFCQKCRWQVTAKHAYTLRLWLCVKWHGAWLYGVHRTCAETAAVSCVTSHASAVSTPPVDIKKQKMCYKKLVSHVESHASAVSLLESREWRCIKVINNNIGQFS